MRSPRSSTSGRGCGNHDRRRPGPNAPPGPDFFHHSASDRLAVLFGSAGLRDAEATAVEFTQRLTGKDGPWEGAMSGTARIPAPHQGRDAGHARTDPRRTRQAPGAVHRHLRRSGAARLGPGGSAPH
ncbi:hypothetical protein GCM10009642_50950 [Nocardiopsis metallicus]